MPHAAQRPLSPHLQVYRPQLTSMLSICHRFTGMCLTFGSFWLAAWLITAAIGEGPFSVIDGWMGAWYGRVLMIIWTYALCFHLCNGIRHLGWDAGFGFELRTAYATGYLVVIVAALLTAGAWILALV